MKQTLKQQIKISPRSVLERGPNNCSLTRTHVRAWRKIALTIFYNKEYTTQLSKHGYIQLIRTDNEAFFKILEQCGFFQFHRTNKEHFIIYEHQVSLFLQSGWKWLLLGYICKAGQCEIHHIDHNHQNNHPSNLIYVSPVENKFCSSVCHTTYRGTVNNYKFNKKRLARLAKLSFQKTYEALGFTQGSDLYDWIMNIPKEIGMELARFWHHPERELNFIKLISPELFYIPPTFSLPSIPKFSRGNGGKKIKKQNKKEAAPCPPELLSDSTPSSPAWFDL